MFEITVLSGKGGTGKTSITAALASIAKNVVLCDNDVDAADLHLILKPEIKKTEIFLGAWLASVNEQLCSGCGICAEYCRFDAIHSNGAVFQVDALKCEGCRLCERVCPENAIKSSQSQRNLWHISNTRYGQMVHASMRPGEENSGKLVAKIREEAGKTATQSGAKFILNDGPPGIGCSTISSVTGCNMVLLVVEPSLSGLHDAKRVVQLVQSFNIPIKAVINKADINSDLAEDIALYFESQNVPVIAELGYDELFTKAMILGKTVCEVSPDSALAKQIKSIWNQLTELE